VVDIEALQATVEAPAQDQSTAEGSTRNHMAVRMGAVRVRVIRVAITKAQAARNITARISNAPGIRSAC
jgi:hypothetical protein